MIPKLKSLKDKIEEKKVLEQELVKVADQIEEIEGDKKAKIIKKKK